jgi:hypothetical protein
LERRVSVKETARQKRRRKSTMTLTEGKKRQLDEILDLMNREAEMMLYFEDGTTEWKHAEDVLLSLKRFAENLEQHERTYLENGLMEHKDIHDVYWSDNQGKSKHQREKFARLDAEGKLRSDEEWRRS